MLKQVKEFLEEGLPGDEGILSSPVLKEQHHTLCLHYIFPSLPKYHIAGCRSQKQELPVRQAHFCPTPAEPPYFCLSLLFFISRLIFCSFLFVLCLNLKGRSLTDVSHIRFAVVYAPPLGSTWGVSKTWVHLLIWSDSVNSDFGFSFGEMKTTCVL